MKNPKSPPLDLPIQLMIEAQNALRIALAASPDPLGEENLAAFELAQQILNLHAVYQTQPLQTHEIPALPQ